MQQEEQSRHVAYEQHKVPFWSLLSLSCMLYRVKDADERLQRTDWMSADGPFVLREVAEGEHSMDS